MSSSGAEAKMSFICLLVGKVGWLEILILEKGEIHGKHLDGPQPTCLGISDEYSVHSANSSYLPDFEVNNCGSEITR